MLHFYKPQLSLAARLGRLSLSDPAAAVKKSERLTASDGARGGHLPASDGARGRHLPASGGARGGYLPDSDGTREMACQPATTRGEDTCQPATARGEGTCQPAMARGEGLASQRWVMARVKGPCALPCGASALLNRGSGTYFYKNRIFSVTPPRASSTPVPTQVMRGCRPLSPQNLSSQCLRVDQEWQCFGLPFPRVVRALYWCILNVSTIVDSTAEEMVNR